MLDLILSYICILNVLMCPFNRKWCY